MRSSHSKRISTCMDDQGPSGMRSTIRGAAARTNRSHSISIMCDVASCVPRDRSTINCVKIPANVSIPSWSRLAADTKTPRSSRPRDSIVEGASQLGLSSGHRSVSAGVCTVSSSPLRRHTSAWHTHWRRARHRDPRCWPRDAQTYARAACAPRFRVPNAWPLYAALGTARSHSVARIKSRSVAHCATPAAQAMCTSASSVCSKNRSAPCTVKNTVSPSLMGRV